MSWSVKKEKIKSKVIHLSRKLLSSKEARGVTKQAQTGKMAAVIDLLAPDTVTHQTIISGTSIIPNSVLRSSLLLLPADLNIYSQVFIHKRVFMGMRNATHAGEDKLPHMKR